ncbi:MAG: aspartate kinase [Thermoleophilia bacterium]|nr:aspartate kinase [Thermoleophilia bacterium]MCZ4496769.1 aspartate kinase [Thermoleophilia bacterium]
MEPTPAEQSSVDTGYESLARVMSDKPTRPAGSRPLLVMKFGGTSVADAGRIRRVAQRAVAACDAGSDVVVVASAMGKSTDQLMDLAREVSPLPNERELDMLLSTGERISCALIAMAIHDLGHVAVSLTGSQAGIVTTNEHTNAKIVEIRGHRIDEALAAGHIVLVAGFQGVSLDKNVTTLGRGGSDTTAVALAAALGADACEIYTDVDGVFTADPRIVPDARKLHFVSFEEMLEMAASGARVLMLRSVEFARNYDVPLHVRSSFNDEPGTWIGKADERMENAIISGVTHDAAQARITVGEVPDRPGSAATIFGACAELGINVDMILQTPAVNGVTDVAFTLPSGDVEKAGPVLDRIVEQVGAAMWRCDQGVGIVSLVGAGMKTHPGIAAKMFASLADDGINMQMISTSPIKISCVIPEEQVETAVRCLHAAFDLAATSELRDHGHAGTTS